MWYVIFWFLLLLASGVLFVAWLNLDRSKKRTRVGWFLSIAMPLFLLIQARWAFPETTNFLYYRLLWVGQGYVVMSAIGLACLLPVAHRLLTVLSYDFVHPNRKFALDIAFIPLALLILIGGNMYVYGANQAARAAYYSFQEREDLVISSPNGFRFTPPAIAHNLINGQLEYPTYQADFSTLDPVNVGDGTGYRVPLIPDGLFQTFLQKNRGYMVFDDQNGTSDRVSEEEQAQAFGEGMQISDNLYRLLLSRDFTAYYPNVYYTSLKGEEDRGIVAMCPRTEYHMAGLFVFVQKLVGVDIVFADGTVESLSAEQAKKDPRFDGNYIYPVQLTREIVEAQTFDKGWMSGFYRRAGKIEVPELPGGNQMPFRIKGTNGRWYDVTATEPDGSAHALYKMFFTDALSGENTVKSFSADDSQLLGPVYGLEFVKQAEGFYWFEDSGGENGSSGTHVILEPRYVVRSSDKKLRWAYSVTTRNFAQVIATIVIDAENPSDKQPLVFRERAEFEAWLSGEDVNPDLGPAAEIDDSDKQSEIRALRQLAEELTRRLQALEN